MSFQTSFITALLSDTGLKALINDRLWPDAAPPKPQLPYVLLYEIQANDRHNFQGKRVIGRPVFRFIVQGSTHGEAYEVGEALWAALEASSYAAFLETQRSDTHPLTGVHRRDLDVRVLYVR